MSGQIVLEEVAGQTARGAACVADAKWTTVVDDVLVPMPRRKVPVSLLVTQASVPDTAVLVRDHNSPNDYILPDGGEVDLAEGNVFYRLDRCEAQPRGECHDKPKLAFALDDKFEVTTRPDQTGRSLRELFAVPQHAQVFRDTEGPDDVEIPVTAAARFSDGPVFYTRHVQTELKITVNHRVFTEHDGVKREMKVLPIAALAYPENPANTRVFFLSDGNRELALSETVHLKGCEEFEVVRKEVTGGFDRPRLDRELDILRAGGLAVTLVESPGAVVYHDMNTGGNAPVRTTDVLVPVPGAYPGQMIDWAYLPENSPLFGRVKGQLQDHRITALGRVWRQVSYHPHNGGGAPAWNPTIHGFHTYYGEVLSWLKNV